MAIKKFKHKGLKKFFESGSKAGIQAAHVGRIELILDLLDGAQEAKDMNFPGSDFHPLKGDLKGENQIEEEKQALEQEITLLESLASSTPKKTTPKPKKAIDQMLELQF